MVDQFSKTLDQLMGTNRNATSFTETTSEHFSRPYVDKLLMKGVQTQLSIVLSTRPLPKHEVRHGNVCPATR